MKTVGYCPCGVDAHGVFRGTDELNEAVDTTALQKFLRVAISASPREIEIRSQIAQESAP